MRRMGIQEKYIFAYFVKVRDLLQLLVYYSIKLTFALKFSVAITDVKTAFWLQLQFAVEFLASGSVRSIVFILVV